jgi:nicotinate-nucleotide adenylyltransferase
MTGARVGVLGGTFDPFHLGHLAVGDAAQAALRLDHLVVIPSHMPPHRPDTPRASGYHRLEMARLATAGRGWTPSDIELQRDGPSYTYDTLRALAAEAPTRQFFFITGADAFAEIATWRHYPEILDLAHFVVIARTGTSFDALRARLPALAPRMVVCGPGAPPHSPGPSVFLVNATTPLVSSTDIRQRVAAGTSIDDLVPAEVSRYIAVHHLYV